MFYQKLFIIKGSFEGKSISNFIMYTVPLIFLYEKVTQWSTPLNLIFNTGKDYRVLEVLKNNKLLRMFLHSKTSYLSSFLRRINIYIHKLRVFIPLNTINFIAKKTLIY